MAAMGSSANTDYCAFSKAVEHLGDRWSLLLVRELVMFGPQGFNQLAEGVPGSISRSVLASRLRRLEQVGVVARLEGGRGGAYHLTPAGLQLAPVLKSLWQWAEHWVPEDPAMVRRDPTVVMWWLAHRVDQEALPRRQLVLDLAIFGADGQHSWLLLSRDAEPTLCMEDPLLDPSRYVYVEADPAALFPVARGLSDWSDAIADGSVRVYGEPDLVRSLPSFFVPAGSPSRSRAPAPPANAVRAKAAPANALPATA